MNAHCLRKSFVDEIEETPFEFEGKAVKLVINNVNVSYIRKERNSLKRNVDSDYI